MINGEIDLSIGAVYLFAPFVFEKLATDVGLALVPALILTLVVCMMIGAINGFFVAVVGITSFVVTLGMLFTHLGPDARDLTRSAGRDARYVRHAASAPSPKSSAPAPTPS